jgi:hypothetical protein
MVSKPIIVCLPIADRRTSFTFYRDGVGFEPVGEVADDGVPEPLPTVPAAVEALGSLTARDSCRPSILLLIPSSLPLEKR